METELTTYIRAALGRGAHRAEIERDLLGNGWLPKDVQDAFAEVTGVAPQALAADEAERDERGKYAIASIWCVVGHVVAWLFMPIAILITLAAGLVLSFMAFRSSKRWVAILALVVHLLVAGFVVLVVYVFFHVMDTGTYPGGEVLTEEDYIDMGIDEADYRPLLEKNGL